MVDGFGDAKYKGVWVQVLMIDGHHNVAHVRRADGSGSSFNVDLRDLTDTEPKAHTVMVSIFEE